uniref:SH3 domain-containing protein n=1 Tax=Ciona savignyi TaxID=51511 RepID=H2YBZ0_CIOSA
METFNVEHSEIVVDVAHFLIVPASFGALMSPTPRAMERKRSSVKTVQAQQSTQHRDQILSKYPDTVHVCIRPHHPTHQIELGVNTGDLVGVIKQQDPMGNTGRWFVDNGASQGLIPSSILHLYTRETTSTPNSPQITPQRSGVTNQSFT